MKKTIILNLDGWWELVYSFNLWKEQTQYFYHLFKYRAIIGS